MSKQDNLHDYVTDIAGTIRSVEGTEEKINAQDFSDRIRAIGETSGTGGKTTPSFTSGRANKIIISRKSENSSFYPRWVGVRQVGTVFNAHLFTNNSVIDVDTNTWSFGSPTVLISEEQEGVDDVGDLIAAEIEGASNYLIAFYKANNLATASYSIIGKILQEDEKEGLSFVPELTQTIGGTGSLHQPFVFDNYVYYCEESEDGTRQDIKRAKINYTIVDEIVQDFNLSDPEPVISGENNFDDSGNNQLPAYLGSPVIARLADGHLIIVYDSNVNRDLGYPYTIQYSYSTDGGATWEEGKTLFKTTGYNNKAPYVVVDQFGKVAISYHTNNEYIENSYSDDTVFDYVFKAFISNNTIQSGDVLTPADFIEIPIRRNQANEWTGGYGSLAIINGEVTPIYAHGTYNDNQGTIIDTVEVSSPKVEQIKKSIGLVVYAHEDDTEKTIEVDSRVIGDSIVRRDSSGFVYGSTATNLDPTNHPTILTTKAYVANFGKANYLPLKGGIISGSLAIQGDLTIVGTVTTEKTETLAVKDSVIITNADGAVLGATLSGIAIKKDGENTYGIMYDPSNDSVKLGLGTLDAKNKFTFNGSGTDGKPIATRDDSSKFTNGNLVRWDGTTKSLVDSGKKTEDFVEKVTNTTTSTKAYIAKTDGSQSTIDVDTGVADNTLAQRGTNGRLQVGAPSDDADATTKEYVDSALEKKLDTYTGTAYYPVIPIQKRISATNPSAGYTQGWQQMSVEAINNTVAQRTKNGTVATAIPKSDKDATPKKYVEDHFVAKQTTTTPNQSYLYGYDSNGDRQFGVTGSASPGTIAYRSNGGRLQIGAPSDDADATTKKYVDGFNTITITAGA